jgi:hypothetical protein
MRNRHIRFLLPCVLFAACITIQAQQGWAPGQPAPEFQILEVRGTANIRKPGLQEVSLSTKVFAVAAHDEIRTGPDGYVRLGLQDGSQVEVLGNSRIQIGIPKPSWMKMLDIFLGHIRVVIEHISGKPNPYSFGTPTAVLGVRGTIFDVGVDESTATIVAVSDGSVQVENSRYPGRGVLVKKGYRTIVRPDELPAKPERFTGDGTDPASMATKHGKTMDGQTNGMMSGSQPGIMQPGSGTMGTPSGGTMGNPGGTSMPGGQQGGSMPGMGRKQDPRR